MKRRILIILGIALLVGGFSGLINARLLKSEIREDFLSLYPEPPFTTHGMTGNPTEADRKKSSDEHERFSRHQTMLKSITGSDSKFEWAFRHSAILGAILTVTSVFSFKNDSNQSH